MSNKAHLPAHRRFALIALAIVAGVGALLAVDPQGLFSRAAISDFFLVRLPRNLAEVGMPMGGDRVLPLPVRNMIALLRAHHFDHYRISARIYADPLIQQRILEGAWPIRRASDASWYLAYADEALPTQCQRVDHQGDIIIAHCP